LRSDARFPHSAFAGEDEDDVANVFERHREHGGADGLGMYGRRGSVGFALKGVDGKWFVVGVCVQAETLLDYRINPERRRMGGRKGCVGGVADGA